MGLKTEIKKWLLAGLGNKEGRTMGFKTVISNIKTAGSVLINGNTVEVRAGENISISGREVTVGNRSIKVDEPNISVTITGDVEKVDNVGEVNVSGNVNGDVKTSAGNVSVGGDVDGKVESSCGNVTVKGRVSGDVFCSCGNVKVGK